MFMKSAVAALLITLAAASTANAQDSVSEYCRGWQEGYRMAAGPLYQGSVPPCGFPYVNQAFGSPPPYQQGLMAGIEAAKRRSGDTNTISFGRLKRAAPARVARPRTGLH